VPLGAREAVGQPSMAPHTRFRTNHAKPEPWIVIPMTQALG